MPVMVGDAYQGFRYVATNAAYFAALPWRRQSFALAEGRYFHDDTPDAPAFEALLGAEAARSTGLRIGDRFSEGEEMAEYPFTVVGILKPTHSADDRAIFMSLASFWQMNEVAREQTIKPLTAVLIRPKRMSDLPGLHRERNVSADTQAVLPSGVILTIFNMMAVAQEALTMILATVGAIVLLYVFVAMYSATQERRREIATMRALGARRATVLGIVLLESGTLAGCRRHRRDHWRTRRRHSRGRRAVDQKRPGHRAVRVRPARTGDSRGRHRAGHDGRTAAGGACLSHGGHREPCPAILGLDDFGRAGSPAFCSRRCLPSCWPIRMRSCG